MKMQTTLSQQAAKPNRPASRSIQLLSIAFVVASSFLNLANAQTPPAEPAPAASTPPADKKTPENAGKPAETTSKDPAKPAQSVDKIEVKASASAYDARENDTATKIVVTSEEIKKYGDTQILDVMKRLPGVTVQNNSIRLRGLGNGYTQILIDGERPPPGFSIDNLSPDLVDKIEIIRAATAEFSTQAVAGTVNIIMKKKFSVSKRDLNASYFSGTGYSSSNVSFTIADSAGKLAYSYGGYAGSGVNDFASKGNSIGFDAAGNRILERTFSNSNEGGNKYAGFYSNLAWTLGGGDSFTMNPGVNFYTYKNKSNSQTDFVLGGFTPFAFFRSSAEGDGLSFNNNANWIIKLKEGAKLDLKFNLGAGSNNNDNESESFNISVRPTLKRVTLSPSKDNRVSFAGKYSTPIVEGHALLAGWDIGLNNGKNGSDLTESLVTLTPTNINEDYRSKVQKLAFFAQDEWNVTPNWSVYFGLRWEGIETTSAGNGFDTVTNKSSVASPLFQTLWKFPDKSGRQVRFALTRTYKAPNVQSLIPRVFKALENKSTTPDFQTGNPNLKPELATGVDVAYEHFWAKGASMSISGSVRTLTDFNTRGTQLVDTRWVNRPINNGRATSRSIEFDAKFPLQSLVKEAPPIDFRFNAARNFSNIDEVPGPNNRLDQQTPFNATFGLDYRMTGGKITAGAGYTFRSGGDVRTAITESRYQTPKRELDMYVLYKYTPKFQVRARVANVLRQDTINSNTFFDAAGSTTNSSTNPSKMNIGASVEIKF